MRPGPRQSAAGHGGPRLAREGAKRVETAADIVEEVGGMLAGMQTAAARRDGRMARPAAPAGELPDELASADYARLLDALGWDPGDVDTLVPRGGLTTGELSSMLLLLEMHGFVRSLSGGRYQRVATTTGE